MQVSATGRHSFPKELQAFENLAARLGYDFRLLREVERINSEAVEAAFDKVKDALRNLEGRRIALLGLSFKPDTDDVRFSLALALARKLLDEEAIVVGYDPKQVSTRNRCWRAWSWLPVPTARSRARTAWWCVPNG